jgi:SAM-dependent methyltransferase
MTPSELLKKHLSDKCTHHNYSETYDRLLSPLRDSATDILEIGIENGCSLRAWREYFPNAHIYGLEKEESKLFQSERITTIRCDTTERDRMIELAATLPSFDFICDDGSHVVTEQVWAVAVLWPRLKPGGIYVVEDIYRPEYLNLFKCFHNAELLDLRKPGGCADDMMAVLRKGV